MIYKKQMSQSYDRIHVDNMDLQIIHLAPSFSPQEEEDVTQNLSSQLARIFGESPAALSNIGRPPEGRDYEI